MNKLMSPKQIAANRANALKSTGPRTAAGRAVSRMNALKHGIRSKEVLVRGIYRNESCRKFAALHRRLWEEWQPVGVMEEMLVNQILTAHWRWRRALAAESGEITLSVDEGQWRRGLGMDPNLEWTDWAPRKGDAAIKMMASSVGNSKLANALRETRRAVEEAGELTERMIDDLDETLGGPPNAVGKMVREFRRQLGHDTDGLSEDALRERNLTRTLEFLEEWIEFYTLHKHHRLGREKLAEKARQAAAALPSAETLEKIARYETRLQRQIYRAMAQLERLQRLRRGEEVLPPVRLEVEEHL